MSGYAYDAINGVRDGQDIQTFEMVQYMPAKLTYAQLSTMARDMQGQAAQNGGTLVGYAIYEEYLTDVYVPQSFCVIDQSHCFTLPEQICIPWTNWCMTLPNNHLDVCYKYRFWYCVVSSGGSAYARGAIGIVGLFLWALAAGLAIVTIVAVTQMMQGKITFQQFTDGVKSILRTPGENIAEAEAGLAWPLVAMAVAMVTASVAIPYLSTSGKLGATVPIPGGGQVEGGVELGQQGRKR